MAAMIFGSSGKDLGRLQALEKALQFRRFCRWSGDAERQKQRHQQTSQNHAQSTVTVDAEFRIASVSARGPCPHLHLFVASLPLNGRSVWGLCWPAPLISVKI
jgi:hypothetical protein